MMVFKKLHYKLDLNYSNFIKQFHNKVTLKDPNNSVFQLYIDNKSNHFRGIIDENNGKIKIEYLANNGPYKSSISMFYFVGRVTTLNNSLIVNFSMALKPLFLLQQILVFIIIPIILLMRSNNDYFGSILIISILVLFFIILVYRAMNNYKYFDYWFKNDFIQDI